MMSSGLGERLCFQPAPLQGTRQFRTMCVGVGNQSALRCTGYHTESTEQSSDIVQVWKGHQAAVDMDVREPGGQGSHPRKASGDQQSHTLTFKSPRLPYFSGPLSLGKNITKSIYHPSGWQLSTSTEKLVLLGCGEIRTLSAPGGPGEWHGQQEN